MTRKFASMELARLYETQGYLRDALDMYNQLDDNVLTGGAEVRAAKKRLEIAVLNMDLPPESGEASDTDGPEDIIIRALEDLNGDEISPESAGPEPEKAMAGLMEEWVMLILAQKRLHLYQRLLARS